MHKLRKIFFILAIALILVFALQKGANFYIERQINTHLTPYNITAKLEKSDKLTLSYKGISLTCKMTIEGKVLTLTPVKSGIVSKLLPEKFKIPLR